jgi:hypothetical protein
MEVSPHTDVIQRVENAEDIETVLNRFFREIIYRIVTAIQLVWPNKMEGCIDVRVAGVPNTICATHKCLERNVRNQSTESSLQSALARYPYRCLIQHTRRSHGSSYKNLMATSNVAPPQHSSEYALASAQLVSLAILAMSIVRSRVARSDWCASRHVVSIMSVPGYSRTALAKASGPFSTIMFLQPSSQGNEVSRAGPSGSSRLLNVGMTISSLRPGSPFTRS